MEVQYRSANGRLVFKLTGETSKDLWKLVASIQDTFEAESACGVCGETDIKFQLRLAGEKDEFEYYELVCRNQDCRARFSFGQSLDKKNLFPRRKDKDGNWLLNHGWEKYQKPGTAPAQSGGRQQNDNSERW